MLRGRGDALIDLGPFDTLTPGHVVLALLDEAERATALIRSGELVLTPVDSVDLVLRIRLLAVPAADGDPAPDPAA